MIKNFSKNDILILNGILKQNQIPELSDQENFEIFAFEQILKDYELSYEELSLGKIGVDDGTGLFVFLNDELVDDEFIEEDIKIEDIKNLHMRVFLIRAKDSFSEIYTDKTIDLIRDMFDFHSKTDIKRFRDAFLKFFPKELTVHLIAVGKDYNEEDIHQKIDIIRKTIIDSLPKVNFDYRLINPSELIRLTYKEKSYTLKLRFKQQISEKHSSFMLTTLVDYVKFISDENGKLRRYLFDSNIRDYQKHSTVNKDILDTLRRPIEDTDFWWFNNGVTILTKRGSIESGNIIELDDVQIINGLQTTNVVYEYLNEIKGKDERFKDKDDRLIGIKIITTNNPKIRDGLIKSTNFQNPITTTSLRASDHIQYNIESYFLNNGWYYDRRKNYYKNMGKSLDKIISIAYLAQAILSIVYREPNRARKNPTSLTHADKDYYHIFGSQNYRVFLYCIKTMKLIDPYLKSCRYEESYRTNLRWHLVTLVTIKLLKRKDYTEKDIEPILDVKPRYELIDDTMFELVDISKEYLDIHNITIDAMAKNREFVIFMIEKFKIDNIPNLGIKEYGLDSIEPDSIKIDVIQNDSTKTDYIEPETKTDPTKTDLIKNDLLSYKNK